jgi:hypothetical protein
VSNVSERELARARAVAQSCPSRTATISGIDPPTGSSTFAPKLVSPLFHGTRLQPAALRVQTPRLPESPSATVRRRAKSRSLGCCSVLPLCCRFLEHPRSPTLRRISHQPRSA